MTVSLSHNGAIELTNECPLEDAETLLQQLTLHPHFAVDWRECDLAHTAVVQVLLAAKPRLQGPPRSVFLRMFVEPMLVPR
jgi:hypothetical protein